MEVLTDILLSVIEFLFNVYLKVGWLVLKLLKPIVKTVVVERMEGFGLKINGDRDIDPKVLNDDLYIRSALEGETGMYESYVDGQWTSRNLVGTFETCMRTRKTQEILHPLSWTLNYFNLQRGHRAWQVGKDHYDIGNEVYEKMLDTNMQYTCGYWERAPEGDLDQAQLDKMELIAQKLKLEEGMDILDIGCGFGTLAHYLAKKYKVKVTGCSISKEQTKYGEKLAAKDGADLKFIVCDYRDLLQQDNISFERIVSVGMFEHIGTHNYEEFFHIVSKLLKPNGIFLLHTIGNNHKEMPCVSVWLHRHIFPNGVIPYYLKLFSALEGLFIIEDLQNLSSDYAKTIKCWRENFERAYKDKESGLCLKYGERFYKIWILYLSLAQAAFESRSFQVWQLVLSQDGLKGGYKTKRLFN